MTSASRRRGTDPQFVGTSPIGRPGFWERALPRRRFLTGGAVVGAALAVDLVWPLTALAGQPGSGLPTPIPGGIDVEGMVFHLYLPGPADNPTPSRDSPGGDPSSIFDFNGAVGVGAAVGVGTGTNPDGSTEEMFYAADQRFMDGAYVDRGGRMRNGAFSFVSLEVFTDAARSMPAHAFNPGIDGAGLFWTTAVNRHAVNLDLDAGEASMAVNDVELLDTFSSPNSLFGGGPPPIRAVASFDVTWSGPTRRYAFSNAALRYAGQYVETEHVAFEWSCSNADGFTFQTKPGTAETIFGLLGRERNGSFFH